jgi:hypothetical protein
LKILFWDEVREKIRSGARGNVTVLRGSVEVVVADDIE